MTAVQLNIFFLLFGGLQGLLLCAFIFKKRIQNPAFRFLLIYFGCMLLQITFKVMSKLWLMEHWRTAYQLSYCLPLLYGPLIFLFVRRLLSEQKLSWADCVHIIPFGCYLAIFITDAVMPLHHSWVTIFNQPVIKVCLQLASLCGYHLWALHSWKCYRQRRKVQSDAVQRVPLKWIRSFIIASLSVCVVISISLYFLYMLYPAGTGFRFCFLALTIFIYWVSYCALTKPAAFGLIIGTATVRQAPADQPLLRPVASKYANSKLDEQSISNLKTALQQCMEVEKLYLNAQLSFDELAAKLNLPKHKLSQFLNGYIHQSFYDYLNHFRVEEAKKLLSDKARSGHKIAALAYDAGFNSLSTFNDSFKKLTGHTPSKYREFMAAESLRRKRV